VPEQRVAGRFFSSTGARILAWLVLACLLIAIGAALVRRGRTWVTRLGVCRSTPTRRDSNKAAPNVLLRVSLPCDRLMNLGTPCPRDESARFGGRLSRLGCRKNVTYADPVPIGPDAPQTARNRGGVPLRCNGTASTPLRSHPFIPALRAKSLIPIAGRGCLITGRASCAVFRLSVALSHTSFVYSTTTLANLPSWRKASNRLFVDACTGRRVSWMRCDKLVRLTCPLPDRQ